MASGPTARVRAGVRLLLAPLVVLTALVALTGEAAAEPEPNGTMATATVLPINGTGLTDGSVAAPADVDFYRVQPATAGHYVAEVRNVAAGIGGIALEVLDAAGTSLGRDTCLLGSGNTCARVEVDLTGGQTYYLVVTGTGPGTGGYGVRLLPGFSNGLTWDATGEPNDAPSLAPPIAVGRGGAQTRTIEPRDPAFQLSTRADQDYYRFTVVTRGAYVVEVFDVDAALSVLQLDVFDPAAPNGVRTDEACLAGTGTVCDRVVAPDLAPGSYSFRVSPVNLPASGRYSVRVLPSNLNGLNWDATSESNDVPELASPVRLGIHQAQSIAVRPAGLMAPQPDVDYLRVRATVGQKLLVSTSDLTGTLANTLIDVVGPNGTVVASSLECTGVLPVCSRLPFKIELPGDYVVKVSGARPSDTGSYNVCVRLETVATCTANVLLNPGLETDANADGRPDSWTSSPSFTRSTATAPHGGTFVGRLSATNDSAVTISQALANQPNVIGYRLSGWVNIPATADTFSLAVQVRWKDAAGATIAVSPVQTFTAATAGWVQATARLVPPAGTASAAVELAATSLATTIYVDDLSWTAGR
jgi:hypothetical protein